MEKNNKRDISTIDNRVDTEEIIAAKKEKKPKRYKKGILYNGGIYIPVKKSKESPRIKNLLYICPSFYIECERYLLNGKYFGIDEDMITHLLKRRIYVEYPTDTSLTELHQIYDNMGIINGAEKAVENAIQGKLSSPWTPSYIYEFVKLKRGRVLYEETMKSGNSTSEVILLTRIKYLLSMSTCIIDIRKRFQTSDMEKLSAYHGTFADFAESLSTKFPQIAITEYDDMMEGLNGVRAIYRDCGLLLRMSGIFNSIPILLSHKDIQKINQIESYNKLIEKLQSGKIGKVVGCDVYIRPYEYAMILVNPLKDIESVINTV